MPCYEILKTSNAVCNRLQVNDCSYIYFNGLFIIKKSRMLVCSICLIFYYKQLIHPVLFSVYRKDKSEEDENKETPRRVMKRGRDSLNSSSPLNKRRRWLWTYSSKPYRLFIYYVRLIPIKLSSLLMSASFKQNMHATVQKIYKTLLYLCLYYVNLRVGLQLINGSCKWKIIKFIS